MFIKKDCFDQLLISNIKYMVLMHDDNLKDDDSYGL